MGPSHEHSQVLHDVDQFLPPVHVDPVELPPHADDFQPKAVISAADKAAKWDLAVSLLEEPCLRKVAVLPFGGRASLVEVLHRSGLGCGVLDLQR